MSDTTQGLQEELAPTPEQERPPAPEVDLFLQAAQWFLGKSICQRSLGVLFESLDIKPPLSMATLQELLPLMGYRVEKPTADHHHIERDLEGVAYWVASNAENPCLIIEPLNDRSAHCLDLSPPGGTTSKSWDELEAQSYDELFAVFTPFAYDERTHIPHLMQQKHWFFSVLAQSYPVYVEVFFASIFINIFAVISSVYAMNVYDRVVPNGALETLYTLSLGILLIHSFDFLLKSLRSSLLDWANKKMDLRLTTAIFDQLLHIQLKSRPRSLGGFASQISQFESFREFFASASMTVLVDLPFMFFFMGVIYYLGGPLLWTVLAPIPIVALITASTHARTHELIKTSMRLSAQKNAQLIEYLGALEAIKFWGAQDVLQQRWNRLVRESTRVYGQIKNIQTTSSYLCYFVQNVAYVAMIVHGVLLITQGRLTMGALIGCSILSSKALAPVLQIGQLMLRWQQAQQSLQGMDELMKLPLEIPQKALSTASVQGVFRFDKAHFHYEQDGPPVLQDINLTIKPGDRIAIVGSNASGKTTLIKMLLGLYQPTEGAVLLDEINLQQFDLTALRHLIGYVPQDIQIVHGTIKDNITIGCRHVPDEAIWKAAEISGLLTWLKGHPKGLDLIVGERGSTLSGGQKQALALARALVHNPPILILDEPTSSLDFQAEAAFVAHLEAALGRRTLIMVSHRQVPLRLCQEVVVLQQGRIVSKQSMADAIKASQQRAYHYKEHADA